MPNLPPAILAYLQALVLDDCSPAYLQVDKEGFLIGWGGALSTYGLADLRRGTPVGLQAVFLVNLFPLQSAPLFLPAVETGEGRSADIHIFTAGEEHWVLLLDATSERMERSLFQQKVNELSLLSSQQAKQLTQVSQRLVSAPLVAESLAALNFVPLEGMENGAFRLLEKAPDWLLRFCPEATLAGNELRPGDRFPVLENFLVDAERFWLAQEEGRLCSGVWTETDAAGNEIPLEASALWVRGRKILLLELLNGSYEQKQSLIQKAREHSLQYHHLESRLQKLLDRLHIGVFRASEEGRLLEANPAFAHIMQIDAEESLQVLELQPQNQPRQQREVQVSRSDNDPFWVLLTTTRDLTPDGTPVIDGLLEDITERKHVEEARREEAAVVEALSRVGGELIALLDASTILTRLCQLMTEVLACDSSHAFLWQAKGEVFVPMASFGDPPEQWEMLRGVKIPRSRVANIIARLENYGVAQENSAVPQDAVVASLQQQVGVSVGLYVALRRGDAIMGVLSAGYRNRRESFSSHQERVARGVAQLASMALQNAHLVDELARANHLKEDFLATFSHELRTPLNIILGYTELLLDGVFDNLTDEQAQVLRRVDKSARTLSTLVATTLDLSRLEMDRLPLEVREVALPQLVEEIKTELGDWRDKPDLQFLWRIAPGLPVVRTDPLKLKIVIKNLLSNAVKFTEQGSIIVDVHPRQGGVEIEVTDTGIGMAPDVLPVIFDAFRQVESSMTRRYGGVGLGLYLVRRFLDVLGGEITVESQVGSGSTFRVMLPLVVGES